MYSVLRSIILDFVNILLCVTKLTMLIQYIFRLCYLFKTSGIMSDKYIIIIVE